ncbi:MAG: hypothetical protein JWO79_1461 [Actinomycetia bacterium]|nr:hypothetical protein [Actinomycetes bacterium]MDQ1653410.1 hypothetical protein [Cryptosporangiaceae bacterium]MDQ1657230.1 hypothetical protein [Cryptosporangiaceae bacterium]
MGGAFFAGLGDSDGDGDADGLGFGEGLGEGDGLGDGDGSGAGLLSVRTMIESSNDGRPCAAVGGPWIAGRNPNQAKATATRVATIHVVIDRNAVGMALIVQVARSTRKAQVTTITPD